MSPRLLQNLADNLNDDDFIEIDSRIKIFEEVIISRVKKLTRKIGKVEKEVTKRLEKEMERR